MGRISALKQWRPISNAPGRSRKFTRWSRQPPDPLEMMNSRGIFILARKFCIFCIKEGYYHTCAHPRPAFRQNWCLCETCLALTFGGSNLLVSMWRSLWSSMRGGGIVDDQQKKEEKFTSTNISPGQSLQNFCSRMKLFPQAWVVHWIELKTTLIGHQHTFLNQSMLTEMFW